MFNKSNIEWCTHTWNPVTGCYHGCPYCYARGKARRFAGHHYSAGCNFNAYRQASTTHIIPYDDAQYLYEPELSKNGKVLMAQVRPRFAMDAPLKYLTKRNKLINAPYPFGFCPTFHRYRLDDPARHKKPATVFVGSMADLFGEWVPDEWIERVFEACAAVPWHAYLFLTKNPERYYKLLESEAREWICGDNIWLGSTVTNTKDTFLPSTPGVNFKTFISIEPLLEQLPPLTAPYPDWLIVGAMTGNGSAKHQPKREWIESICADADRVGIPLFMKESLLPIMGEAEMRQEWPAELRR